MKPASKLSLNLMKNLLLILPLALTSFACKTSEKKDKQTYWISKNSSRAEAVVDVKISGKRLEVLNDATSQLDENISGNHLSLDKFCSFKVLKGSYIMTNSVKGLTLTREDGTVPAEANTDFLNGRMINHYESGKSYRNDPDIENLMPTRERFISWPVLSMISKAESNGFATGHDISDYTAEVVKIKIGRPCEFQTATN